MERSTRDALDNLCKANLLYVKIRGYESKIDDPPNDTGQPPTNVLLFLLAPPSPASFVTVSDASTMSCSEDEINKRKGSFVIHRKRTEASPSAGSVLHLVSFEKILQSANVKDIVNGSVKKIGRNCIALSFLNPTTANTFFCIPLLALKGLKAFIPSFNITRLGLVRGIPSDWSPDEILGYIVVPEGCGQVLKNRRLIYKTIVNGSIVWKPSQTVMLTFDGHILQRRMFLYYNVLSVKVYIYPPIQCYSCCRYGHTKDQCRSQPRCYKCGNAHIGEFCTVKVDSVLTSLLGPT
ncbi:hypothetical protein EVAR_20813_1 [Eumeta japonica]|uniref:CCHC-type domain-containing protein n=1 Tax=Eumeta variegata TaxID=151549 RepID=A0A4C1UDR9_EUMVA|nr:hypothetical protein EVAR_20813_1 [Eumeta japonica]